MKLLDLVKVETEEENKIDKEEVDYSEMSLSDGLDMLIELLDEDALSTKEVGIIAEMFEKLDEVMDEEEDEEDREAEAEYNDEDIDEAKTITQHSNTAGKRMATFKKSGAGERIKTRRYQRIYRRRPEVKTKAKRKAARQKTCGKNQTAQLSKRGGSSYACRLKDKFKAKLMIRVARLYGK